MIRPFDLAQFIRWLTQFRIDYLLIGGHAMRAWGSPRFTHDFDFWFRPSDRSLVLQHLEAELEFELSSPPESARPTVTATRDAVHIDCLFVRGMTTCWRSSRCGAPPRRLIRRTFGSCESV